MRKWISLTARDGRHFDAFLVSPPEGIQSNGRGLIVLPEVYNVNEFAKHVAQRYAALGYNVVVLDLFWRQAPNRHYGYDQPEPAREQGANIDVDAVVTDVGIAAEFLRKELYEGTPVVVIGYCLGGRLAALAGAREAVDAVVSYYGVRLEAHLDELSKSRKPTLYLFGGTDPWVPPNTVAAIRRIAASNDALQSAVYPAAGHGFDRTGFTPFDPDAAADAQTRVLHFFDSNLPHRAVEWS